MSEPALTLQQTQKLLVPIIILWTTEGRRYPNNACRKHHLSSLPKAWDIGAKQARPLLNLLSLTFTASISADYGSPLIASKSFVPLAHAVTGRVLAIPVSDEEKQKLGIWFESKYLELQKVIVELAATCSCQTLSQTPFSFLSAALKEQTKLTLKVNIQGHK